MMLVKSSSIINEKSTIEGSRLLWPNKRSWYEIN